MFNHLLLHDSHVALNVPENFRVTKIYIRAGSTDADSGGKMYTTSLYSVHPQYNPSTSDYDVGVIKLLRPITLDGTNTKAVSLVDEGQEVPAGTELMISGWGDTSVRVTETELKCLY